MWFCPGITGLSYNCSGVCYENIKLCSSASGSNGSTVKFNLDYTISGSKVTFPAQSYQTFMNGAVIYFMVA